MENIRFADSLLRIRCATYIFDLQARIFRSRFGLILVSGENAAVFVHAIQRLAGAAYDTG